MDALGIPWCFRADAPRLAAIGAPFIINLDDRTGAGTHWVAACLKSAGGLQTLYYADPLGTLLNGYPPKELERYRRRIVSRPTFQHPASHLCGYYAIAFVNVMRQMPAGVSQKDFEDRLIRALAA